MLLLRNSSFIALLSAWIYIPSWWSHWVSNNLLQNWCVWRCTMFCMNLFAYTSNLWSSLLRSSSSLITPCISELSCVIREWLLNELQYTSLRMDYKNSMRVKVDKEIEKLKKVILVWILYYLLLWCSGSNPRWCTWYHSAPDWFYLFIKIYFL